MENRGILFEIINGVSILECEKRNFYFKHPSIYKKEGESTKYDEFEKVGKRRGLLSESELIADAIKNKGWSEAEDKETKELIKWIAANESQKAKLSDPQMLEGLQKTIDGYEKELHLLQTKRHSIVSYSLENFIARKISLDVCGQDVYLDEKLTKQIKTSHLKECLVEYHLRYHLLSLPETVVKTAYEPNFFDLVILYDKDVSKVFDKNIYNLTVFQKDILSCAKTLLYKLQNIENIPPKVRKDPILLFTYNGKREKEGEDTNIREFVGARGGVEGMQPKDKVT